MKNASTLRVGLDVHKESIAVAYAGEAGTDPVYVGEIGTRLVAKAKRSAHAIEKTRLRRLRSARFVKCECVTVAAPTAAGDHRV
jgi:hypothetical protein